MQQDALIQDAVYEHAREGCSHLHTMLPDLMSFKSALRQLLAAETAKTQELRRSNGKRSKAVEHHQARIVKAQIQLQKELNRVEGQLATLHASLPPSISASRAKSCPLGPARSLTEGLKCTS